MINKIPAQGHAMTWNRSRITGHLGGELLLVFHDINSIEAWWWNMPDDFNFQYNYVQRYDDNRWDRNY